jgi:hypothetical protein
VQHVERLAAVYALNTQLPTVQVLTFPQAGHGPQRPVALAEHIATFVGTPARVVDGPSLRPTRRRTPLSEKCASLLGKAAVQETVVHRCWSILSTRCGAFLTVVARDLQIKDLRCGSSIMRFGWSCKLLIRSALGGGSSGWIRAENGERSESFEA